MIEITPLPVKSLRWEIDCSGIPREYRSILDYAARLTILKTSRHENCSISLHEVSKPKMARINLEYRRKNAPTNVISISGNPLSREIPDWIPRNLGDIFLCFSIIRTESIGLGIGFLEHLVHLVVHSTLHLNGYDHLDDESSNIMENMERKILKYMGIRDPYTD